MEKYDVAIFCGRFQPFHKGHSQALKKALIYSDQVVVLVGSSKAAPTIKNPFTFDQRRQMIEACLTSSERSRTAILPLRDHFYSEDLWLSEFQEKVSGYIKPTDSVALVGRYKDSSSYYLNLFPQWDFLDVSNTEAVNATDIRKILFERDEKLVIEVERDHYGQKVIEKVPVPLEWNEFYGWEWRATLTNNAWKELLTQPVIDWLENNYFQKYQYAANVMEYRQLEKYKAAWANAPYPPTFVTADSVVLCAGHVLLVKRKFNPGLGQYALPGGFIKQNERIVDAALRELREETGISTSKAELLNHVEESKVFDYPGRSLRGRTITHAYCVRLPYKTLPEIRAGSDADSVVWMPLADALAKEDKFFEDHYSMLCSFLIR